MRVAVFSTKHYDHEFLTAANAGRHRLQFLEPGLTAETAALAAGFGTVCAFVNDHLDATVIERLRAGGTRLIVITGHQGFFTREALENIAATTIANLSLFENGGTSENFVAAPKCAER